MTSFGVSAGQSAPARTGTPGERSTEFVAVQGGTETTSAELLLVVAYCAMWTLLLGFVFLTWRRQHSLERRLTVLEKNLPEAERAR